MTGTSTINRGMQPSQEVIAVLCCQTSNRPVPEEQTDLFCRLLPGFDGVGLHIRPGGNQALGKICECRVGPYLDGDQAELAKPVCQVWPVLPDTLHPVSGRPPAVRA